MRKVKESKNNCKNNSLQVEGPCNQLLDFLG